MIRIIASQIVNKKIVAIKTLEEPSIAYEQARFQVAMGKEFYVSIDNEEHHFKIKDGKMVEIPVEIMKKLPSF